MRDILQLAACISLVLLSLRARNVDKAMSSTTSMQLELICTSLRRVLVFRVRTPAREV